MDSDLVARIAGDDAQRYGDHVQGVEQRAVQFGKSLGLEQEARLFARYHDLGKLRKEWQERAGEEDRPPHAPYGAHRFVEDFGGEGLPLAATMYGHHSRLYDLKGVADKIAQWNSQELESPDVEGNWELPESQSQIGFWLRMLFSACVDADRLDAEAFTHGPRETYDDLPDLWKSFREDQEELMEENPPQGSVNAYRNRIYRSCVEKAGHSPGYFTATIPTGGGKTRSLAAFALRHAIENDLRRVVVAVPYTSIIEQNAAVYRDIFGRENVVEHHSLADLESPRNEKATQNWDAPFIITTTVQLFESLYASHSGRARKIHRLAESVIVLDEMQALPARVLEPCLRRLRQLIDVGSSVVCSTATNPGFDVADDGVELVDDPGDLADGMQRVAYHVHPDPISHVEFARHLSDENQALAVCNTVDDARAVWRETEAWLLTSRQCPIDRTRILDGVQDALDTGRPVTLISTQLVEAGVDIDFPVVYRVCGPAPSIIQAAGRCNREGRLERGDVHVLRLKESSMPPKAYRAGTSITENRLEEWDFADPHVTAEYFDLLSETASFDEPGVLEAEDELRWRTADRRMAFIEDGVSVLVLRNEEAQRLFEQLKRETITSEGWRALQKYAVTLYPNKAEEAASEGKLEHVDEEQGISVWNDEYDPRTGIRI
jgi:CRISPR-associated endonuclease/helicase Cas3